MVARLKLKGIDGRAHQELTLAPVGKKLLASRTGRARPGLLREAGPPAAGPRRGRSCDTLKLRETPKAPLTKHGLKKTKQRAAGLGISPL